MRATAARRLRRLLAGAALALVACAPSPADQAPAADARRAATEVGVGRVVWESNRSGAFRIWTSDLDGGGVRRLSPEEPGRDHCCARLSPDGERLAYLSMPVSRREYLPATVPGELRLVRLADDGERTLSKTARHIGYHRALVWWSPSELAFLAADGSTRKLDLALGTSEVLLRQPADEAGWLVAPGGAHATSREVSFSERDPESGRLRLSTPLGGCEPVFSADGELGLWVAGAGGPLDVVDLASRETRTLVRKNDPRLPEAKRYLYFPALSPDRTLLAYAASGGRHDHFRADYDVFVVDVDAETLALAGTPRPIAPHRGVDRYPDVWRLAPPRARRTRVELRPAFLAAPTLPPPVFVWNHATDANRRTIDADSEILRPRGAVWTDRRGRLALAGGRYEASPESAQRVAAALAATNTFSLAALVEPAALDSAGTPLVALSGSPRERGFVVQQRGAHLELLLRSGKAGEGGAPIPLALLVGQEAHHVALSFSPGRLAAYLDGVLVERRVVAGDFYHWRVRELWIGAEPGLDDPFRGSLSHLLIWNRELSAAEAAGLAAAARAHFAAAAPVATIVARTRLVARSRVPTLAEVSPYRRALVVEEHELVRALEGEPPARFRVARWALLDGEPARALATRPGDEVQLRLELYDAQPQLEGVVLADTLPASPAPLYFAVGLGGG